MCYPPDWYDVGKEDDVSNEVNEPRAGEPL